MFCRRGTKSLNETRWRFALECWTYGSVEKKTTTGWRRLTYYDIFFFLPFNLCGLGWNTSWGTVHGYEDVRWKTRVRKPTRVKNPAADRVLRVMANWRYYFSHTHHSNVKPFVLNIKPRVCGSFFKARFLRAPNAMHCCECCTHLRPTYPIGYTSRVSVNLFSVKKTQWPCTKFPVCCLRASDDVSPQNEIPACLSPRPPV